MEEKLLFSLISLASVCIGFLIQYFLGKQNEKNKKAVEIRSQAYLDLINIVSEIASSAKHENERDLDQLQKLTQAKSRVILIGSNGVVTEVHKFFSIHSALNSQESFDSFTNIVSAMRSDLSGESRLSAKVLSESLFGK